MAELVVVAEVAVVAAPLAGQGLGLGLGLITFHGNEIDSRALPPSTTSFVTAFPLAGNLPGTRVGDVACP